MLPDGLTLERGGIRDFSLLEPLGYLREQIETQLDAGGELWLVTDPDAVTAVDALVFSCWLYPRRTPMRAARHGWLDLPDRIVCIEHVHTAPSHRGRGIAPAVYAQLADTQALRGTRTVVMIVRIWNAAALRAAEKAGFREIATMVSRRRGPLAWVHVTPSHPNELAQQLAVRLER